MEPNSETHARGNRFMNAADLIGKLVEIERAVESMGLTGVHRMVQDAEEAVFQFEERVENGTECFDAAECSDSAAFEELSGLFMADRTRREFGPFSIN